TKQKDRPARSTADIQRGSNFIEGYGRTTLHLQPCQLHRHRRSAPQGKIVGSVNNSVPSRTSRWRRRRASLLSRAFRDGDTKAAFSLRQRRLAYRSLETGMPWSERLVLARAARRRNRAQRNRQEQMDRLCRPWRDSAREL